eukprot:GHVP01000102.1.p1 GENE.GHVP01000102.1~~GHVP01000102.1.p1  ORF type:complete len:233 (+),score=-5.77 GHVP01000102.1:721-1419(+)
MRVLIKTWAGILTGIRYSLIGTTFYLVRLAVTGILRALVLAQQRLLASTCTTLSAVIAISGCLTLVLWAAGAVFCTTMWTLQEVRDGLCGCAECRGRRSAKAGMSAISIHLLAVTCCVAPAVLIYSKQVTMRYCHTGVMATCVLAFAVLKHGAAPLVKYLMASASTLALAAIALQWAEAGADVGQMVPKVEAAIAKVDCNELLVDTGTDRVYCITNCGLCLAVSIKIFGHKR